MKIEILDKTKKKKIIEQLKHFGIEKIPHLLIRTGTERIRAFSGNLSSGEIMSLWSILPFEGIGLYVAKEITDKHAVSEIRLSVDALHLFKDQIKNNILILTEEQEKNWFKGRNLEIADGLDVKDGYVILESFDGKDFIGMGKLGGKTIYNYLPKERRRKSQEI